jgi:4-hydroxy-3-methylbut-2-enyl diphosphate reductase IspH
MSDNKNKVIVVGIAVTAVIAIIVAACLYFENAKNKEKIAELEEDKLKLILDSLQRNTELSEEIKKQLQRLIARFKKIDIKISNEIAQALQLYQIGQKENAIEDLVKIIEHLLTTHFKNDSNCKKWLKEQKRKFDLHNLLAYCKEEKKIDEIEYQFFLAIKTIRNKEDHTLDLKLDEYINASGIITAIGGISKIAAIVYPKEKAA